MKLPDDGSENYSIIRAFLIAFFPGNLFMFVQSFSMNWSDEFEHIKKGKV